MDANKRESETDLLKTTQAFGCMPFSLTCIYSRQLAFIRGFNPIHAIRG
jgi:hypothetical protein